MVDIRTFDGPPEEMGAFLEGVWTTAGGGRVTVPLWSQEFLDWTFFDSPAAERDYLVAGYEGGRLVAAFLALPHVFRWGSRQLSGSLGSWLTVDPAYRSQFVAARLLAAMRERHAGRGAAVVLGFGFPTKDRMSLEFWEAAARAWPRQVAVGPPIATWVRVLDPVAVARGALTRLERFEARLVGLVQCPVAVPAGENIRPAKAEDAASCLRLLEEATAAAPAGLVWDESRLRHQLGYGSVARSMIAEVGGRVVGWVNFHYVHITARDRLKVGVIDHCQFAPDINERLRLDLMRAALARMRCDGASLASALKLPIFPGALLFRAGFVPQALGHRPIVMSTTDAPAEPWPRAAYAMLR